MLYCVQYSKIIFLYVISYTNGGQLFMFKKIFLLLVFLHLQLFSSQTPKEIFIVSESWKGLTNRDGSGLYFDLARMIYEPAGIRVKIKIYPYKRSSMMVKNKRADAWLGSYIDEEDYALYPKYYFDHDIVIAMYKKKKFPHFNGLKSLKDKDVCWVRGYDYNEYINIPIKKHERNDRKSILLSLEKDRFDVFLDAKYDMRDAIERFKFDTSGYGFSEVLTFKLYPAFRNDERGKRLRNIWDKNFKVILDDGSLKKLYIKHKLVEYYIY